MDVHLAPVDLRTSSFGRGTDQPGAGFSGAARSTESLHRACAGARCRLPARMTLLAATRSPARLWFQWRSGAFVSASESPSDSVATIGTAEAQRLGRFIHRLRSNRAPYSGGRALRARSSTGLRDAIDKTVPRAKLADKATGGSTVRSSPPWWGPFDDGDAAAVRTSIPKSDPFTIGIGDYPHCNNRQTFGRRRWPGLAGSRSSRATG